MRALLHKHTLLMYKYARAPVKQAAAYFLPNARVAAFVF